MIEIAETENDLLVKASNDGYSSRLDSRFRLIVVAAVRTKQLLHGSTPRIEANPLRRRNTSIALEEVRRGLVGFTILGETKTPNESEKA